MVPTKDPTKQWLPVPVGPIKPDITHLLRLIEGLVAVVERAAHEVDRALMRAQLHLHAARVARDPEHIRRQNEVANEIEQGIPEDRFIGREELLAMRHAVRHKE